MSAKQKQILIMVGVTAAVVLADRYFEMSDKIVAKAKEGQA